MRNPDRPLFETETREQQQWEDPAIRWGYTMSLLLAGAVTVTDELAALLDVTTLVSRASSELHEELRDEDASEVMQVAEQLIEKYKELIPNVGGYDE